MNALLFAHVGIRTALLSYRLIGRVRNVASGGRLRSRLMTTVVFIAALDAAWRFFGSAADPSAWGLDSLFVWAMVSDVLLTVGLLAAHRRQPAGELAQHAQALRAARVEGKRAEANTVAARMASLVREGHPDTSTNSLLRDLRTIADGEGTTKGDTATQATDRLADATLARIGRELCAAVPPGITVRLDFSDDLGPLRVDPRELRDALHRVAHNAVVAMPHGGSLRMRAAVNKIGDRNVLGLTPGHWMRVELTDNGVGMKPEQLARCQDPFFSTHDDSAGLGLPATAAFVRRAGGAIEVDSGFGSGTSVTLWLPACLPSERRSAARDLLSVLTPKRGQDPRFITQP